MSTTYGDVLGRHDVDVPAHLVADAEVPVLSGMQRQGDVPPARCRRAGPLASGAGAAGSFSVRSPSLPGRPAYLLHPEHGGQGIGPGSYVIRRQREQADEIRVVAD